MHGEMLCSPVLGPSHKLWCFSIITALRSALTSAVLSSLRMLCIQRETVSTVSCCCSEHARTHTYTKNPLCLGLLVADYLQVFRQPFHAFLIRSIRPTCINILHAYVHIYRPTCYIHTHVHTCT